MKMVSYWKNVKEIYNDNGYILISGRYNHEHVGKDIKYLDMHYIIYPSSRGVLSPLIIILSGLLLKSLEDKESLNKLFNS